MIANKMGFTVPNNKNILYASVAAVVLFIVALSSTHSGHAQKLGTAISDAAAHSLPAVPWATETKPNEPSWHEVAVHHNTDKVNPHSYQDMYDKYLPAFRHKKIKMLEIGLGCDMGYGPGHSYYAWLDYFSDVDLYFMEYNAICAEAWANHTTQATVVTGDQGDPAVLQKFIADHGTDFDIIIDDGGHTMVQQILSLQILWQAIKPGGMYFCEDLETSWVAGYGGQGVVSAGAGEGTMLRMIHRLVEDMTYPLEDANWPKQVYFKDVEKMVHIDCSRQICAFEKRRLKK